MKRNYSERLGRVESSVIRDTMKFASRPGVISLGAGSPASESLPVEAVNQIASDLLAQNPIQVLQYGITPGYEPLRKAYLEHLVHPKGIDADIDNTLILTGSCQGIYLTLDVFIDAGDTVLVENPTFINTLIVLRKLNANIISVDTDNEGIIIEDLERKIRQNKPKLLYTVPTFQNPTGRTIPEQRRKKIAELAAEHNMIVLEDDPYGEVRFAGKAVSPIKKYDVAGNVILLNSFSKLISPGLRVGAVTASADIISQLESVKQCVDTHTDNFAQAICAEFLRRGMLPAHLERTTGLYRERLEAMLRGVKEYFPADCQYSIPEGGFFIWVRVPGIKDAASLLEKAVNNYEVLYVPGTPFCVDKGEGKDCMRLNYSSNSPDKIEEAMKRLGGMLKAELGV